jgi:glycosyltransferase involved in cell wall biosynthesis
MPLIRIKISNAKLMLVGKNPTDEMKNYANKYSDVVVTGEVDSVDPYYQQANVFVNAVYEGSGINIKMIEAMGKGLPIVSSEYGARGINCEFINFGYLYQDASECADYIAKLSKDKSLAVKMAKTARECYEQFNIPQNDVMKMLFDNL